MAVIALSDDRVWVLARWAFNRVLDSAIALANEDSDAWKLEQARALDGLHFHLMEPEQSTRISGLILHAIDDTSSQLKAEGQPEQRDREFADVLREMRSAIQDLNTGRQT